MQRLETCLSVNGKLCEKIVLLVPSTFDDNLKGTSVTLFVADFDLLSCQFDNLTLTVILIHFILMPNIFVECINNTYTVPDEKSRIVSLTSLIMKNILLFPAHSRFPVKLIFSIAFGSASSSCYLLRSIAIT